LEYKPKKTMIVSGNFNDFRIFFCQLLIINLIFLAQFIQSEAKGIPVLYPILFNNLLSGKTPIFEK